MSTLPFASIQNEHLRLDYLTTTGPRIIGLFVDGVKGNLLAETPNVHWSTPHGEYYLRGGHRLWTAPEDPFYTPPEEDVEVVERGNRVTLKSPVDVSGLQKEIEFCLENTSVQLLHRITWHGENPIQFAPWTITQLKLGGLAILPLPHCEGLLPDRNLVLWPYSQIKDERLEMDDELILIHGQAKDRAFKIGNYNSHGWIAYALGSALFIKRFPIIKTGNYPDFGCNVEAYVKDTCVELESLGTLKILSRNESITYQETWEIIPGEYPPTWDSARKISKQLSQP